MRSNNIEKQGHLLTAVELKRRGITRYDAEILISQGIPLPDPRSPIRRSAPPNIAASLRKRRPVKRKTILSKRSSSNTPVSNVKAIVKPISSPHVSGPGRPATRSQPVPAQRTRSQRKRSCRVDNTGTPSDSTTVTSSHRQATAAVPSSTERVLHKSVAHVIKSPSSELTDLRSKENSIRKPSLRTIRQQSPKGNKSMPELKRELAEPISAIIVPVFKAVQGNCNKSNNSCKSEMPTLIKEEITCSDPTCEPCDGKISPSTETATATVPCHLVPLTPSKDQHAHGESWAADSLGLPAVPDCSHVPSVESDCVGSSIKKESLKNMHNRESDLSPTVFNLNPRNTSALCTGAMKRNLFDDNFPAHYDSELIEQQGWKVPKLTLRKRCMPKSKSAPDLLGDQNSTGSDVISSDSSSTSPTGKTKKKKKKRRHREWRETIHGDMTGLSGHCYYSNEKSTDSMGEMSDLDGLQQPLKRFCLKFDGSSVIDIIPQQV